MEDEESQHHSAEQRGKQRSRHLLLAAASVQAAVVCVSLTEELERLPHAHLEMIQAQVFRLHAYKKNNNNSNTQRSYTPASMHTRTQRFRGRSEGR
jgi:hypothetical protein